MPDKIYWSLNRKRISLNVPKVKYWLNQISKMCRIFIKIKKNRPAWDAESGRHYIVMFILVGSCGCVVVNSWWVVRTAWAPVINDYVIPKRSLKFSVPVDLHVYTVVPLWVERCGPTVRQLQTCWLVITLTTPQFFEIPNELRAYLSSLWALWNLRGDNGAMLKLHVSACKVIRIRQEASAALGNANNRWHCAGRIRRI